MSKTLERPRFSIVIPCYNEEHYIGDTLVSLKNQDFEGTYEIIVVDNNSTDNSVKIVQGFDDVRIVYEKKAGVCWARQKGTELAGGEIVVSTDADTIFSPHWLRKLDAAFSRQSYVAVAGPCMYRSGPFWGKVYPILLFSAVHGYAKLTGHPFYITATNLAFKKEYWDGYDVHSPQGGDELAMLHQLKKKGRVGFCYRNPVFTSARRLKRGLFYNIFVTLFYYYICGYYIDRIFKRTIIGSAPAYRFNVEEETMPHKPILKTTYNLFFNKIND